MKKRVPYRVLKRITAVIVILVFILYSFPYIFKKPIIEYTTRLNLPSNVKITNYSVSLMYIDNTYWGINFNPLTARITGNLSQPEDSFEFEALLTQINKAISLQPIEDSEEFLLSFNSLLSQDEIYDADDVYMYSSRVSSSPRIDILLLKYADKYILIVHGL